MARGFTVKANVPAKSQEPEWDFEKAKEMVRGKSIVFCLPGRGVSYVYLKNFVQLCFDLVQAGAAIQISQDYSSMVNFARCKWEVWRVLHVWRYWPCTWHWASPLRLQLCSGIHGDYAWRSFCCSSINAHNFCVCMWRPQD